MKVKNIKWNVEEDEYDNPTILPIAVRVPGGIKTGLDIINWLSEKFGCHPLSFDIE